VPPLTVETKGTDTGWMGRLQALGGGLGWLVAAAAIWVGYRSNNRTIVQRANENELAEILDKLDKFYGPYLQLSETNRLLAQELFSRQPKGFRTLPALLDPDQRRRLFESRNDELIVAEIVRIGTLLDRFVRMNSGLVDLQIQEYLARAGAHFRVIRLAYAGKLVGDPEGHFAKYYVYPWQLDKVLKLEVARLQARCKLLRERPSQVHPPLEPLPIPAELALSPWPDPRHDNATPPNPSSPALPPSGPTT